MDLSSMMDSFLLFSTQHTYTKRRYFTFCNHIYIYTTHTYIYIHIYVCTYIHTYIHTYTHTQKHTQWDKVERDLSSMIDSFLLFSTQRTYTKRTGFGIEKPGFMQFSASDRCMHIYIYMHITLHTCISSLLHTTHIHETYW